MQNNKSMANDTDWPEMSVIARSLRNTKNVAVDAVVVIPKAKERSRTSTVFGDSLRLRGAHLCAVILAAAVTLLTQQVRARVSL